MVRPGENRIVGSQKHPFPVKKTWKIGKRLILAGWRTREEFN
jgi:hypothetical protein